MARAATVALLTAALALPASAQAWSTNFEGEFGGRGGTLSFKLKRKDGQRTVSLWTWNKFPVTCKEGDTETSSRFSSSRKPLPVRHREFAGRAVIRDNAGRVIGKAKVDGGFEKGYETATGQFRVTGVLPPDQGDYSDCDSGLITWDASTVGPAR